MVVVMGDEPHRLPVPLCSVFTFALMELKLLLVTGHPEGLIVDGRLLHKDITR